MYIVPVFPVFIHVYSSAGLQRKQVNWDLIVFSRLNKRFKKKKKKTPVKHLSNTVIPI